MVLVSPSSHSFCPGISEGTRCPNNHPHPQFPKPCLPKVAGPGERCPGSASPGKPDIKYAGVLTSRAAVGFIGEMASASFSSLLNDVLRGLMFGAQIAKLLPITCALEIRFMSGGRKHLQEGIHPKEGQSASIRGLVFRFVLPKGKESDPEGSTHC